MANQRISSALGWAAMSPTLNVSRPVLRAAIGDTTWGNEPLLIPRISRERWLRAAVGGLRLHIGNQGPNSGRRHFHWSACIFSGQRRVWDSNPRGRVNALAVFKTGTRTLLTSGGSSTRGELGTHSA